MKRGLFGKFLAFVMALILLTGSMTGCGKQDYTNGSPWLNSSLYGNVSKNIVTDPKQDLHLYANKDWLLEAKLPAGSVSWSNYEAVGKDTVEKAIDMLQSDTLSGHDAELAQGLYRLYIDLDARNKVGYEPLKKTTDRILAINTLDDLKSLFLDEELKYVIDSFVSLGVDRGISDAGSYYVYIGTIGLIMDDAAEYSEETEYGKILRNCYKDLFVYMAGRLGMDKKDAAKRYENTIALERKLSQNIYTSEESMRSDFMSRINNVMEYEEVIDMAGVYPMEELLNAWGLADRSEYIVIAPEYIKALGSIYTQEYIPMIRDYLLVGYVLGSVSMMDEATIKFVEKLNKKYFGVAGSTPTEERGYNAVRSMITAPLSKEYIKKYSSEEDRRRVEEMCYEVIDTYRVILEENDWASEETKEYAIKKLNSMTVNVGWPERWEDYSGLDISGLSYYDAYMEIGRYNTKLSLDKLNTTPDKEDWAAGMCVLDCNAFYDPSDNSINMIVGMMGAPFYYSDMPVEELYASLGAFWIGHEISHAFDSNGAQYDIDGNLNDWWTEKDLDEFNARVQKMDDYLDGILIMGDYYVTGSNVDSEMIADMTGVQCALKMAEKVEGFDYAKFFEYYAKMNRSVCLYAGQLSQIQGDPHPLDYQRTNVPVQQFEEFYTTYGVKEGDGMYLAPEDRLIIW